MCVRYFLSFFSIIPIQHWETVSNPLKLGGAHPLRLSMREVTHVYIILQHILMKHFVSAKWIIDSYIHLAHSYFLPVAT